MLALRWVAVVVVKLVEVVDEEDDVEALIAQVAEEVADQEQSLYSLNCTEPVRPSYCFFDRSTEMLKVLLRLV